MTRRMIGQVVSKQNLLLLRLNSDDEVSFRIIQQRLTLTTRPNRHKFFLFSRRSSFLLSRHKNTGITIRETLHPVLYDLEIFFAGPVKHLYLLPELLNLLRIN